MKDARPAARPRFIIALVLLLLGTLSGGLNAAPAGDAPPAPPTAAAPAPPPTLIGKIAHIRIFGSKNIRADTIQAVLTQKVGDFYSPANVEKDRAAVKDMGLFNGPVVLNAAPSPAGGVDLNYTVTENPVVTAIKFTANTPTKEPTIPAAVLFAQMKTQVGQVLNTNILVSDLAVLFKRDTGYVAKQGYLFDVSKDINIDPPTGVLTIPLVEAYVQSIQITGNSRVKTADILAQMHTKSGDIYNSDAVQKDYGVVYEMGDFKQVGPATLNGTATPGQVTLTLPVVEHEAAQGVLDEKQGKVVPFVYDPVITPFPVIQVSVNGQPPLPFMVDTGATAALLIDPWAATRLGLKRQDLTEKANGYSYATVPIQRVVFQGINRANDAIFGPKQAQIVDLSVLNEPFISRHVAGIVGLAMLSQSTTRFDFAAKTLTVFSYPHPPLRLPGATVLPLRSASDSLYTVHVTLAPGTAVDLTLDTGSDSTAIPLAAMSILHPTATTYGGTTQIDGLFVCPTLRLSGLSLGTLEVPDVVIGTVPPSGRTALGLNILAGYRMTLDGPNAQLTLEPSAAGGRYVKGRTGLDVRQMGGKWTVRELSGVSPARKAGVRVGDEITAVNGRSVQGLSGLQVRALTDGLSGMPLRVSLRRGRAVRGKNLKVSWVPLDKFSAPRNAVDGLTMQKPNGSPWIILNVLAGCPGDRAGLRAGDEITRMNGASVASMSLDQIVTVMVQASESISLVVTRTGRAEPFSVKLIAPNS